MFRILFLTFLRGLSILFYLLALLFLNRNYFDTTFVDQKVLKARLDVEKLLDNTLDVYDTFYEMLCDLDKKYQLVYNNGDKLYTVFKEQFRVNLYNVY